MKAIIFPNDPLFAYIQKGEIVDRYYNPGNIFSDIDIVSLSDYDVKSEEAQRLAGSAKLRIHSIGKVTLLNILYPSFLLNRIIKKVRPEEADIIIAYNSSFAGFLAAKIGKMFNIPVLISMHTNPDKDIRAYIKWYDIKKNGFWLYSSLVLENYTLGCASRVICAYDFITDYLVSRGVGPDRIKVIYHRVDIEKFRRDFQQAELQVNDELRILCVGRIFERKNPENIIRAIKNLNARLTIVGDGTLLPRLVKLSRKIGVSERVNFIKSVPYDGIERYYKNADVFACVNDYGGISKPVMEAMAASLPVVVSKPLWEKTPELIEDTAVTVENSSAGFEGAFRSLLKNREEMIRLGEEGFLKIKDIKGYLMEEKLAEVIRFVVNSHGKT